MGFSKNPFLNPYDDLEAERQQTSLRDPRKNLTASPVKNFSP